VFGSRIPLKTVARLCRTLGQMLNSGVPLLKSLDVVARKTGNARCQSALAAVTTQVRTGTDLAAAFRKQGH
jgi:type IV pilus assembly protein PilC